MNLINKHWQDGGTGITNFDKKDCQKYLNAIILSKRQDLVIFSRPLLHKNGSQSEHLMLLHLMQPPREELTMNEDTLIEVLATHCLLTINTVYDLSDFWEIYRTL